MQIVMGRDLTGLPERQIIDSAGFTRQQQEEREMYRQFPLFFPPTPRPQTVPIYNEHEFLFEAAAARPGFVQPRNEAEHLTFLRNQPTYRPMVEHPNLWMDFAQLGSENKPYAKFAATYGWLFTNDSRFLGQQCHFGGCTLRAAPESSSHFIGDAEVLDAWKVLASWHKDALDLLVPLGYNDLGQLAKLTNPWLSETRPRRSPKGGVDVMTGRERLKDEGFDPDDLRAVARYMLNQILNVVLRESGKPDAVVRGTDHGKSRLCWKPNSLAGALALQLAEHIGVEATYVQCKQCPKWFLPSPPLTRSSREYCSDNCRVKAYQSRRTEAVREHLAGASIAELATRYDTAPDTIRNWVRKAQRGRPEEPIEGELEQ